MLLKTKKVDLEQVENPIMFLDKKTLISNVSIVPKLIYKLKWFQENIIIATPPLKLNKLTIKIF